MLLFSEDEEERDTFYSDSAIDLGVSSLKQS